MEMKRRPIRRRMQRIVLALCVASLVLTGTVGLAGLITVRDRVIRDSTDLGDSAAGESQTALLSQMEQNLLNVAESKAEMADAQLGRYMDYINSFAQYINWLYSNRNEVILRPVAPPDAAMKNKLSMQRYLTGEDVELDSVLDEVSLFGNLEQVWMPVISNHPDMITTIYVGSASGFMISLDDRADLAATGGEAYYDYTQSTWYQGAMERDQGFFTETYPDSYGRGLTISCAAPFHDERGAFAGVVCMDILISDLNRSVIDIDYSEGSYAILVDSEGSIIASPDMDESGAFENIMNTPAAEASGDILSGKTGVTATSEGVYYAYAPITASNWTLVIHVPEADVVAPAEAIRETISSKTSNTSASISTSIVTVMSVFGLCFAVIVATVVYLSRRFARELTEPLLALGDDVKKISGGDLKYRAQILTNDEIGDLAEEFNLMTESLDKYVRDLTTVTAEKERIGAELNVATQIQSSMLPSIFPAFPERQEFDIFASMTPAKEVGGDFYDFFMVDERHLAIVMADVSGKGVPAALFMVIGKTLIKDHTVPDTDLGVVFMEVNRLLCQSNSEGLFITAFEGVLDLVTGQFNFVNAGHEMPFIKKAGGRFEPQKIRAGFVLAGMEGVRYRMGTMKLEPGDKLFQYTDGVTEATNAHEELYGMGWLEAVLNKYGDCPPMELLPAVKADIDEFVGEAPQFDDITMLCLEYKKVMEGTDFYEITIDAKVENIPVVTDFVNRRLEDFNCPESILSHIDIAVDELFSNIAQYAYSTGDGMATVRVETEDNPLEAIITFIDKGKAYDPLNFADPDTSVPIENRDLGGLGRYIVRKTMDSVTYDYKSGQNILTIRKSLTP